MDGGGIDGNVGGRFEEADEARNSGSGKIYRQKNHWSLSN
jgi:hypothetical protein